jgi:hypothetical protein
MELFARQGDLVVERLPAKPPGEFSKATDFVFAGDSSGHPHTLRGTALVQRQGRVTRVSLAEATTLDHGKATGHEGVRMEAGEYEIRPKRERGDGSDQAVED